MYFDDVDGKFYDSTTDFPTYGGCKVLEVKEGKTTLCNCSDISQAPTTLASGSVCICTDQTSYTFTGGNWVAI